MAKWTGLDPAGTEQIWNTTLLRDSLEIFKRHEPFSRNKASSPIFNDLEEMYPNITWREKGRSGFRPIFRRNNPWAKLGLITSGTKNVHVTPLGDEILSGEKGFPEVFAEATRDHRERDGTPSYAIMCSAALELPSEVFSLEDIEFAISANYRPDKRNLRSCLAERRSRKIAFPPGVRRPRSLSGFMKMLVFSGALAYVSGRGWILNKKEAAKEVSSGIIHKPSSKRGVILPATRETRPAEWALREIQPGRREITITPSALVSNPEQRAERLEKANSTHAMLVEMIGGAIRQAGGIPFDHHLSIDASATSPIPVILEVKTLNSGNARNQIRNAVAKLYEYRWRWKTIFPQDTRLIIVTNENPSNFLDNDLIEYLTVDRGLKLFWLDDEQLVDSRGGRLQDLLAPEA